MNAKKIIQQQQQWTINAFKRKRKHGQFGSSFDIPLRDPLICDLAVKISLPPSFLIHPNMPRTTL